jgi:acyl-CoA synthetase (AMP-forming)/AMP-acid ligase II
VTVEGEQRPAHRRAVGDLVTAAARTFGSLPAVVAGDVRLDYRAFGDRVSRLAAGLLELGHGRGDRIALLANNSLPVLELHFAVAMIGATIVPLNTRFSAAEVAGCLADCGADLTFVDTDLADRLPARAPRIVVDGRAAARYAKLIACGPLAAPEPDPADVVGLFYTSGSTGAPKGVQLTHDNVLAGAVTCALAVGLPTRGTWLHASPMFHLADAWAIWATTLLGGCHVIERFDAPRTLDTLRRERVTHTLLVPTALDLLADAAGGDGSAFTGLSALLYGGAPIAELTYRRLAELGAPLFHTYGSTETAGCMTVLRPDEHLRPDGSIRLGTVGREVPLTEIVLVDDGGAEVAPGEVGEITVRAPNVMLGYHNAPELTGEALADGRYRTGDLGRRDAEGYLELTGRKKEMLITGGENVYPNEVELALRGQAAVRDVGVGGLPDDRWGQRIAAVVVLADGASFDLAECRAALTGRLAGYKIPRAVFVTDELPRNGSGKIDRTRLGSLLAELDRAESGGVLRVAAAPNRPPNR